MYRYGLVQFFARNISKRHCLFGHSVSARHRTISNRPISAMMHNLRCSSRSPSPWSRLNRLDTAQDYIQSRRPNCLTGSGASVTLSRVFLVSVRLFGPVRASRVTQFLHHRACHGQDFPLFIACESFRPRAYGSVVNWAFAV